MCSHDDQFDYLSAVLEALLKHLGLRERWVEATDNPPKPGHWEVVKWTPLPRSSSSS